MDAEDVRDSLAPADGKHVDWLKIELARSGKTQTALARHLGIDSTSVNKILSGNRRLQLDEYEKAKAFFGETQTPPPDKRADIVDEITVELRGMPADEGRLYEVLHRARAEIERLRRELKQQQ